MGGGAGVNAQEIVQAAYQLLGLRVPEELDHVVARPEAQFLERRLQRHRARPSEARAYDLQERTSSEIPTAEPSFAGRARTDYRPETRALVTWRTIAA